PGNTGFAGDVRPGVIRGRDGGLPSGSVRRASREALREASGAPMTCQEFLARYSEYLDERLEPLESALWRAHMNRCPSCARYDRVLRRGLALVRDLPEVEPSSDFGP